MDGRRLTSKTGKYSFPVLWYPLGTTRVVGVREFVVMASERKS